MFESEMIALYLQEVLGSLKAEIYFFEHLHNMRNLLHP
jgi:hypothetical protein